MLKALIVVWRGVQSGCGVFFFQICSRTHSDCLPFVDSIYIYIYIYIYVCVCVCVCCLFFFLT